MIAKHYKIEIIRDCLIGFSKEEFDEYFLNLSKCIEYARNLCVSSFDSVRIYELKTKGFIDQDGFDVYWNEEKLVCEFEKELDCELYY